jgi:hypothetical protein
MNSPKDISSDRRASLRMPLVSKVIFADNNGKTYQGIIQNINTFGVYVQIKDCPVSSPCELTIVIEGTNSQLTLDKLSGEIVRKDENGMAITFNHNFEWLPLVPLLYHKVMAQRREPI